MRVLAFILGRRSFIFYARAMSTLGFDRYVEPLKIYLAKYRDSVRGDRPDKKGGDEYGAQPKIGGHGGPMGGAGDAPIFAFESTSGVMVIQCCR